jgi:protein SCO1/2
MHEQFACCPRQSRSPVNKGKIMILKHLFTAGVLGAAMLVATAAETPKVGDKAPDFAAQDQDGKTVTEETVQGKVFVAEYFFTTCQGICKKMNHNLEEVYQKFATNPDFRILSHSVDPGTDSVARLKQYADSLKVNSATWSFLTGSKDSLYVQARRSYLLDSRENDTVPITEQFIHTQFFALADREGRVRKIYDGLKKSELQQMERDIEGLLKERPGKISIVK